MGVEPLHPTSKYGYIIPQTSENMSIVERFQEKPTLDVAADLIDQGALWNCGVFACRLDFLMRRLEEQNVPTSFEALRSEYETLEKRRLIMLLSRKRTLYSFTGMMATGKISGRGTL